MARTAAGPGCLGRRRQFGGREDRLARARRRFRPPLRRSERLGSRGSRRFARVRGRGGTARPASSEPGSTGCRGPGRRWRRRRDGCAMIAITSGIVSRVSPPARSTGLLRLHRGGRWSSICGQQVVGQRQQLRDRWHGWHRRSRRPSRRRWSSPRRSGPSAAAGWRRWPLLRRPPRRWRPGSRRPGAGAVEHTVVGGERAGVAGCGPGATGGGAALDQDHGLRRRDRGQPVVEGPAVGRCLRRRPARRRSLDRRRSSPGSRPRRPRRRCRPIRRGLPRRPLRSDQFMNDDTKLPDWLAIPIAPAGG